MMPFDEFVTKIVDLGIEAAKRDYTQPKDRNLLDGAIAGFEECRGKSVEQLSEALQAAKVNKKKYFGTLEHWYYVGFLFEVEWVCNVVSAARYNQGLPIIIQPTIRGMQTAAKILGVDYE